MWVKLERENDEAAQEAFTQKWKPFNRERRGTFTTLSIRCDITR